MRSIYDPDSGHFVSERHQYVASIVRDYNPELVVRWIPPEQRETAEEKTYPFAIFHEPPGRPPYVVMLVKESEMDQRVLERLFLADQKHTNVGARIAAANAAAKMVQEYERAAEREALRDFHTTLLKSPLHTFKHNGKVYK